MHKMALIALFAAIPSHSYAGQCGENRTTLAINECLMQKIEGSEQRLESYLSRIQKKYASGEPKIVSLLVESQTSWRSSREKFCRSVYQEFAEGTIGNSVYARCMLQQTDRKTHDLWEWYLTYWDSTPPDLPEPVMDADGQSPSNKPLTGNAQSGHP